MRPARFFTFLADTASSQLSRNKYLQIMFGIGGEHDLSERELPSLEGWNQSRPVRIGNAAWTQRQLDVYGELLRSALIPGEQAGRAGRDHAVVFNRRCRHSRNCLDGKGPGYLGSTRRAAALRPLQADVLGWLWDCAVRLAQLLKAEDKVAYWTAVREQIREAILTKGWSQQRQAFTQAFGSDQLDASCLHDPNRWLPSRERPTGREYDRRNRRSTYG